MGEELTRWTVRLAVACYLGRVFTDAAGWRTPADARRARWLWTLGGAIYLVHVACAFHFYHGWSHAAALRHTAERTAEVVGWHWGGGLWINYAFTLLWCGDIALWWTRPADRHPRSPITYWTIQAIFAFLMFNATAVFGPPFWRWVVVGVVAALLLLRPRHNEPTAAADVISRRTDS